MRGNLKLKSERSIREWRKFTRMKTNRKRSWPRRRGLQKPGFLTTDYMDKNGFKTKTGLGSSSALPSKKGKNYET
jgi:hypothetical protein